MNQDPNSKPLTDEEIERLMEEDYWNRRAQEEADYFAQQALLQEMPE